MRILASWIDVFGTSHHKHPAKKKIGESEQCAKEPSGHNMPSTHRTHKLPSFSFTAENKRKESPPAPTKKNMMQVLPEYGIK